MRLKWILKWLRCTSFKLKIELALSFNSDKE